MDKPRLLDRIREAIRVRHYRLRTEEIYLQWVRRFVLFHGKWHPKAMGEPEISSFLSHLAVDRNVAASAQNQALAAILFLYTQVLGRDLDWLKNVTRVKRPCRLPVVLSREEVQRILGKMVGINGLLARLMYGTGMREMESMQSRVKDIDFAYRQVCIREGKGNEDRVAPLPEALVLPLQAQLEWVLDLHNRDLAEGFGTVYLPPCAGAQISAGEPRMGVAVPFPVHHAKLRSAFGRNPPAPLARPGGAARVTQVGA